MAWYYETDTNKWLYIESGADVDKWAYECCCEEPVSCGECDPPLDAVYTVTLSGFSTASDDRYQYFDGSWDVPYVSGCTWQACFDSGAPTGPRYFRLTLSLDTVATPVDWQLDLVVTNAECTPTFGWVGWKKPIADLDPCGTPPAGGTYAWYGGGDMAGDADEDGTVSASVA